LSIAPAWSDAKRWKIGRVCVRDLSAVASDIFPRMSLPQSFILRDEPYSINRARLRRWRFDQNRMLREIHLPCFVVRNDVLSKFVEHSRFDLGARPLHEIEIELQVVQGDETQSENFFCLD